MPWSLGPCPPAAVQGAQPDGRGPFLFPSKFVLNERARRPDLLGTCSPPVFPMRNESFNRHLQGALVHQRSGRWKAAEEIYDALLQQAPEDTELIQLKGLLLHQQGRHVEALDWLDQATASSPSNPTFHFNRGTVLAALKRWNEAIAAFRHVVHLDAHFPGAHFNLGVALHQRGRVDEAMQSYRDALAVAPDADPANNLGLALKYAGRLQDAIASFRQALTFNPAHSDAAFNLANALKELGDSEKALSHYLDLLPLHPKKSEVHFQIGLLHQHAGRMEQAEKHYVSAVQENGHPESANNLALIVESKGRIGEAEALYRQAIQGNPSYPDPANNLGNLLQFSGRLEEALACYHHALRSRLNDPSIRYNRALALLATGRWTEGWQEYRWRWQWDGFGTPKPAFHQAWWKGEDLTGQTLLVWCEQGLGDTIHFVRYLPLAKSRCKRVIFAAPRELRSLLEGCPGVDHMLKENESIPAFDAHVPLMDLPAIFESTPEHVPNNAPYLRIPPLDLVEIPTAPHAQLKVGVVWAGGTRYPKDHLRSLHLTQLKPLLDVPNVAWYSLQVGPKRAELRDLPPSAHIYDLGGKLKDFRDTASVMCQMDLVVSTCTSALHLAGALGRPTWALLSFAPCWRWMLRGESTPWYPTMRLFRQKAYQDWGSAIQSLREALILEVQKTGGPSELTPGSHVA